MPQAVLLVAAAMGVYKGLRWLSKELARHADGSVAGATRRGGDTRLPKNLGTLDYDPQAGVYRPRAK